MMKSDLSPLMPVKHPDGHYAGQGNFTNPVAIQAQGGNARYRQNDLWMTAGVKLTPIKGLIVNADYTWNYYGWASTQHVRNFYDYTAVPGTENYYPWTNPSSVTRSNSDDYYSSFNAFAEYNLSLGNNDHNMKFMVGYNQEKKRTQYYYAGRKDLIDPENPAINQAIGDMAIDGNMGQWAVNGTFARFNYDYKGRYLLELNGRYDGSSKFKKGHRYQFFPSISAAWRISEEKFFEGVKSWWDNMKLRVSYGSLGNQAVNGNFPYLATYGINTKYGALLGGGRPVAVFAPGLVSSSFTWETVNQIDFGFDAAFLRNRLSASFDWYRRNTKDMLTDGEVLPAVLGASVPRQNAANLKTVGWELSLEWNDRLANGLSYHVKGVLSDYQSMYLMACSKPNKRLMHTLTNLTSMAVNGLLVTCVLKTLTVITKLTLATTPWLTLETEKLLVTQRLDLHSVSLPDWNIKASTLKCSGKVLVNATGSLAMARLLTGASPTNGKRHLPLRSTTGHPKTPMPSSHVWDGLMAVTATRAHAICKTLATADSRM